MEISFDSRKSAKNARERNLPFEKVVEFEWETAIHWEDRRFDYPEQRILAMGFLDERLYVLCYTKTKDGIRVISFRKANKRELRRYEKEKTKKNNENEKTVKTFGKAANE